PSPQSARRAAREPGDHGFSGACRGDPFSVARVSGVVQAAEVTPDEATTHDDVVRTEFARQAAGFGTAGIFAADPRLNAWVCRHLEPLTPDMLVLEVACGAAHQAEVVAGRVRHVVGVDLTPEMLDAGRRRLAATDVRNVLLEEGNASALPFVD